MSAMPTILEEPRDARLSAVTYAADIYCTACAVREYCKRHGLEGHGLSIYPDEALDLLGRFNLPFGAWREQREHEWDTDEFPKWAYTDMLEPGDRCCKCDRALA